MPKQFGLIAAIKFLKDLKSQGRLKRVDIDAMPDDVKIKTANAYFELFYEPYKESN